MRAIIIDDEERARKLLQSLVREYCPEITEMSEASGLLAGINLINKQKPDIVFLDIEMPNISGLEILDHLGSVKADFHIIFTTAFSQYALDAFKLSAIDYLLKPIDTEELKESVRKVNNLTNRHKIHDQLKDLKSAIGEVTEKRIALQIPGGAIYVKPMEIMYFKADGMYSILLFEDGSRQVISKPLKFFIDQLHENPLFFRTHRSCLVNLKHVTRFSKREGITLANGHLLPLASSVTSDFQYRMDQLHK